MNIRDLTIEEIKTELNAMSEQSYRAVQLFDWLHSKMILSLDETTNIGNSLKKKLVEKFDISFPSIYKEYISNIDETRKYLILLNDGNIIESVLMKYKYGYSLCISSQVGCNMGCSFCASTIGGLKRNLEIYELLSQVYLVSRHNNIRISHIVIMGSGEPFNNFDNLVKFLDIINDEKGQNISLRNVTISTCGIVDKIFKLADLEKPLTLALSLHAPNDVIRKELMPIANKYSIAEVLDAMAHYFEKTNRRITFEYSLIKDVNDGVSNANDLVNLFKESFKNRHIDFNVNLIPVNVVKENDFERPDMSSVNLFKDILENNHISVTVRRELGKDISGSCGQLRASVK
ncbi:MAG: 23S rRNA (adenine(2503)-C(2))-methyltransferase RlmN [Lachnospiraceae bacterium]|nr:23S rRNA (adenine(2503)-C(2))-methyltransferase RlmN [Lachnospiraceae bacterium]